MSRIHRRDHYGRGDWSLRTEHDYPNIYLNYGMTPFPSWTRFFVDMVLLSQDEIYALTVGGNRGCPTYSMYCPGMIHVRDIEVTQGEAQRIANGEHPRDVLLGSWPECGFRVRAVPVDLASVIGGSQGGVKG